MIRSQGMKHTIIHPIDKLGRSGVSVPGAQFLLLANRRARFGGVHRPEVMASEFCIALLAAQVGGHDDDGVLKIHCSSMRIGDLPSSRTAAC